MEYLQNIFKTFLYLIIITCGKLTIVNTVKGSNLSSQMIFKSYFLLQNFAMQFGEPVFAVVTKVIASA